MRFVLGNEEIREHLVKYIEYIRNTGLVPILVEQFDDDWEPIGPIVRTDLLNEELIFQVGNDIFLTIKAEGILNARTK